MGWCKTIEDEKTGVNVTFWEVISVVYNHREQQSDLCVGGWISKSAYDSNKDPAMVKNWTIPSGLAPELATGAVAFVSSYAKTQPEFEGYTEV